MSLLVSGKMSCFGGLNDKFMSPIEGLALYEPREADKRPDLFFPAASTNPNQPTWQRLNTQAPYFAMRFDHSKGRKYWQEAQFIVKNPKTGKGVIAYLVDWGPGEDTGRVADLSPGLAERLALNTDDQCEVTEIV